MIYFIFGLVVGRILISVICEILQILVQDMSTKKKFVCLLGLILWVLTISYFLYKIYPVLEFV